MPDTPTTEQNAPNLDIDPAVLDAAVQRALAMQAETEPEAPAETRAGAPVLNAPEAPDVTVGEDRGTRWQRRAARFILGHIQAGSRERHLQEQGVRTLAELAEETLNVTPAQARAEQDEARRILETRVRDLNARARAFDVLDNYEDALHQLRAVPQDERVAQTPLVPRSERTMSTLTDTAGGYLVPEPMLAGLLVYIEEYGYVRSLFRTVNMTSDTLEWKKIGTKPVAAWYGELERITASDMTFGDGGLSTSKLAGITSWSKELQEDALVALLPTYIQLMGEAMAEKESLAGIKGDGTSAYGGFRGVLDLGAADGASIYTLGSGDTSRTAFNIEDAIAAKNTLSKARRRGARWLLSESAVTALVTLKRNNEANNFILLDPNSDVGISRLLGYPVADPEGIEDEFFPTDGAGTAFGAFGDFSRSLFGVRRGMTVETTDVGVLNDGSGNVTLNALQQDAVIAKVTERVAIGHPQPDAYVILKTAAS
jgi:HK97 family phage major capsid protein